VLAKHLAISSYKCDLCTSSFSTQNSLRCHQRKIHLAASQLDPYLPV
jgi:transposase-like protein